LAKLTFFEAILTTATDGAQTEIAILAHPNSQLAAIHALTDILIEASRISCERGSTAAHMLRVSHWRIALDGKTMECSLDTGAEHLARPAVVIAPKGRRSRRRSGRSPDGYGKGMPKGRRSVPFAAAPFCWPKTPAQSGSDSIKHSQAKGREPGCEGSVNPASTWGEVEHSHGSKYVEVLTMLPIRDL
jgi:hypothetical protein